MHSPNEYTQAFVDFRAAFSQVWTSHDELAMEEGSHRIFGGNMGPHSLLNRHQNGLRTLDINTGAPVRLGMMSVIFCVSLLAVSFPTLSKRVKYLQIPRAVFFIGKHFGTGVILSTAFVHLLQDAFECLQDPDVKKSTNIGSWTGFIVLGSLLIIFVIEYISTSFVDRYHSYPSAPPSPKLEPASLTLTPEIAPPERTTSYNSEVTIKAFQPPLENTPLLGPSSSRPTASSRAYSQPTSGVHGQGHVHVHDHTILEGHHRHEQRCAHGEHHERPPRDTMNVLDDGLTRTRSHSFSNGHAHTHVDPESISEAEEDEGENEMAVGRKRQIVGILVLQLGIMIHSLVIGLTLAIASGTDFTSLVTAIVFHQLFEGLSLGIRIAGLPAPDSSAPHQISLLKPILASLFAVTTPVGILIGLASFGVGSSSEEVRLKLIEGIMSAISAGMLIYAACVEMLAGDFVLDPTLWRSGIGRQAVALISLLAGVMAMAVIGLIH